MPLVKDRVKSCIFTFDACCISCMSDSYGSVRAARLRPRIPTTFAVDAAPPLAPCRRESSARAPCRRREEDPLQEGGAKEMLCSQSTTYNTVRTSHRTPAECSRFPSACPFCCCPPSAVRPLPLPVGTASEEHAAFRPPESRSPSCRSTGSGGRSRYTTVI